MIKIEKKITIIIDGGEAHTLKNICELASLYMAEKKRDNPDPYPYGRVSHYQPMELKAMNELMEQIFDA